MSDYNEEVESIPSPVKAPVPQSKKQKRYIATITWCFEASSEEEATEIAMTIQSSGSDHVDADSDLDELREVDE